MLFKTNMPNLPEYSVESGMITPGMLIARYDNNRCSPFYKVVNVDWGKGQLELEISLRR